jgi:photosystem II stability/assembly factor-like uncharacterized protein
MRYIFITLISLFCSCTSTDMQVVFTKVNSPTSHPLREIQRVDDSTMYMISGILYSDGGLYKSNDGGYHWTIVNQNFNGGLFGVFFKNKNEGTVTGWPSTIYNTKDGGKSFVKSTNGEDIMLKSPIQYRDKSFAAGGIGFEIGALWQRNSDQDTWQITNENRSFNKIIFNNSNTGYLAGYGLVQRSTDIGKTWNTTECKGDVWIDIDFTSSQVGYALGYEGKVMKTNDDGLHWTTMRSSNGLFQSTQFAACDFVNESRGMIVGYDGAIEWTDNGGYSWNKLKPFTNSHIRDVIFISTNSGFVIGDDGLIFSFVIG